VASNTQKRWNFSNAETGGLAFISNVTAGALLIAVVHGYNNTELLSITDDNGNSWARVAYYKTTGPQAVDVWMAYGANAGATTISWAANLGEGNPIGNSFAIYEYAGLLTASTPLDQHNGNTGLSTTPDSGAITTTQAAELLFAATSLNVASGSDALTADGDYTELQKNEDGNTAIVFQDQERIVTGTLTDTANWTRTQDRLWAAEIVSFKAAAAAAGNPWYAYAQQ
jgi:hypothetical protein